MTVASFIASQRTVHGVPHAVACRALGVPESTFYKWRDKAPTVTELRRADIDARVKESFDDSEGTYGSPRVLDDLLEDGVRVTKKTVEASMVRQGFYGRKPKGRRKGLTRPDKRADPIPDLVKRDFTASEPDEKWCGDFKQIDTVEGPTYLSSCEDLFSRRMLGFALSDDYPDAELAKAAINMAVATRGGVVEGVIFHTDKGTQGGFKWSLQHLSAEVFDGTATWVDGDVDGASGDAVAWQAARAPRCRAGVLGEDCRGFVERERRDGVWCLGSGRFSLVPRSWWDAIDSTQSVVRQVSDVC